MPRRQWTRSCWRFASVFSNSRSTVIVIPNAPTSETALLTEFQQLWAQADSLWDQYQDQPAFGTYVSADYLAVYRELQKLQGRVTTVLEWGSGLGIVTIMASRMGFEAYGIEVEIGLVEHARKLADQYQAGSTFAHGSFIPNAFDWNPAQGNNSAAQSIDAPDGYDQFDINLRDFDLIYGYPWPDERDLFHNIIREFGSPNAMLLSYDAREGTSLVHIASS